MAPVAIEEEPQKPSLSAKPCQLLVSLMQQRDEAQMKEVQEVLETIEYQLANGRQIDSLEWAGPLDIVKAVIDAMDLYE